MDTVISMQAILDLLKPCSVDTKKWLADRLYEEINREEQAQILSSAAYKEAIDDIQGGRVTTYSSSQEMFDKFHI